MNHTKNDKNEVKNNIIFGRFSQFPEEFPKPHHQCTAMSAVALAYSSLKSVKYWNSDDLDNILRAGQVYYQECRSYLLSQNSTKTNTRI